LVELVVVLLDVVLLALLAELAELAAEVAEDDEGPLVEVGPALPAVLGGVGTNGIFAITTG
jgi:hypothetical protein